MMSSAIMMAPPSQLPTTPLSAPSPSSSASTDSSPPSSAGSNNSVNVRGSGSGVSSPPSCPLCRERYRLPLVLPCLHVFCTGCLEGRVLANGQLTCPQCCQPVSGGLDSLLPDYAMVRLAIGCDTENMCDSNLQCLRCQLPGVTLVARCLDCPHGLLCADCAVAHTFLGAEGHQMERLSEPRLSTSSSSCASSTSPLSSSTSSSSSNSSTSSTCANSHDDGPSCSHHPSHLLTRFCQTCQIPVCSVCCANEHAAHPMEAVGDCAHQLVASIASLGSACSNRAEEARLLSHTLEQMHNKLQHYHDAALRDVEETYTFYLTCLEERRCETVRELEQIYHSKQIPLNSSHQKLFEVSERLETGAKFVERLVRHSSNTEVLLFNKLLHQRLQPLLNYPGPSDMPTGGDSMEFEFISNFQAIQAAARNTFGYVRHSGGPAPPNIPPPTHRTNGYLDSPPQLPPPPPPPSHIYSQGAGHNRSKPPPSPPPPWDKWVSGNGGGANLEVAFSDLELSQQQGAPPAIRPQQPPPGIKRQKMIYHCKFGEFGVTEGQFTEPSGVTVNAQGDVIVADTNNHRIQIFDCDGRFKFQFGECGKRDGQLLYPNRVAVHLATGDIVVTERAPTHQIQLYNQYGQFVRKFGAGVLQHPRGVTVDHRGRVLIVECKVMRVVIFSMRGDVLHKFSCSHHLHFPNGIVTNDRGEIFISDNRAHCVKVFSYEGSYLREIGGEGLTNYPIGVGINPRGEILIADNHNNFNVTLFSQEGRLLAALESKVKHAQCFDVALLGDGAVVLASKDYRLYVYRYGSGNPPSLPSSTTISGLAPLPALPIQM